MNVNQHDFQTILNSAKELVSDELTLTEKIMQDIALNAPQGISERLLHLMQRKGKRIRSTFLCLVAASGKKVGDVNNNISRVAHACAGVELLHLASLVHDDIIDSTEVRRGVKTAHKEWGNQVAVLIGDYLLSQAMCAVIDDPDKKTLEILSEAANRLIVGEIQELDNAGNFELSYETYLKIIRGKTAALSEASARLGALIAGFDNELIDSCGEMGSNFGLAFQIIDDLLDYGYGAENLDKAKFTDLENGLFTLPLIFYFEKASAEEKIKMRSLITESSGGDAAEQICAVLKESGAFEKTKKTAIHFLDTASEDARKLPESSFAEHLAELFLSMSERTN